VQVLVSVAAVAVSELVVAVVAWEVKEVLVVKST